MLRALTQLLLLSALLWSCFSSTEDRLLLHNANLIDVHTGEIRKSWIEVSGSKILKVSPSPLPTDGKRVHDLMGAYVIPGLIDSHVHLSEVPGFREDHAKKHPRIRNEYFHQLPRSYLYFGFTTLIDLNVVDRDVLNDFKSQPLAPDLYDCDNALAYANGYPMSFLPEKVRFRMYPNFVTDAQSKLPKNILAKNHTPEAAVGRAVNNGAICIKAHYEKGFIKGRPPLPTMGPDLMQRIAKAAQSHTLPFLVHANSLQAQKFAVANGASVLAHGAWHWAPAKDTGGAPPQPLAKHLSSLKDKGVAYMPTLRVLYGSQALFDPNYLNKPELKAVIPPSLLSWYGTPEGEWFKEILTKNIGLKGHQAHQAFEPGASRARRALKYASEKGAHLLFGSDTPAEPTYGNYPGANGYFELLEWERAGVEPLKILQAATIHNAKTFRLDDQLGSIEEGKTANLLILKKNPLLTTQAYDTIEHLVLRGKLINRSTLRASSP